MNKFSLYVRLAVSNIKRNMNIYLPYMIACVVSILTYYNLLFINQNDALETLRGASYAKTFTGLALYIIGFFCILLLFYTNSFLIKNHQKELGLYSILGLEKKNIGFVLTIETLLTSLVSICVGILLSVLFSKLFLLILLKMSKLSIGIPMPFSIHVCLQTTLFFLLLFGLILLYNLFHVKKSNPIKLLSSAKTGEKEPKASLLISIIGAVSLIAGYTMAVIITDTVMSLFGFLVAALLVIIATYSLFNSGSVYILKRLKNNKNYYYKRNNFIYISNMIYRMKQNASGLATICILSCALLVAVVSTVVLYFGSENALDDAYPADYQIAWHDDVAKDQSSRLQAVLDVSEKQGIPITNLTNRQQYRSQVILQGNVLSFVEDEESKPDANVYIITVEEYNKQNQSHLQLAKDEILFSANQKSLFHDSYVIAGQTYQAGTLENIDAFDIVPLSYIPQIYIVMNEDQANSLPYDIVFSSVNFDINGTEKERETLYQAFIDTVFQQEGSGMSSADRASEKAEWYGLHGGFLFLAHISEYCSYLPPL